LLIAVNKIGDIDISLHGMGKMVPAFGIVKAKASFLIKTICSIPVPLFLGYRHDRNPSGLQDVLLYYPDGPF